MAMFALTSVPLINILSPKAKQVWYADDAAAGKINYLTQWWATIPNMVLHAFSYFVNPAKTCLVVKEKYLQQAINTFGSTGIKISCEGARYLGAPIGTDNFIKQFVREKVADWQVLSSFATSQLHAAYSAMTHGLSSQWLFFQRTVPDLSPIAPSTIRKHNLRSLHTCPNWPWKLH